MQNKTIFLEFSLKYDDGALQKLGLGAKYTPPSWHPCSFIAAEQYLHKECGLKTFHKYIHDFGKIIILISIKNNTSRHSEIPWVQKST